MLLETENIVKRFRRLDGGFVRAVDGVSLSLSKEETLGLVGESGCGKTTVGRSILRLIEPTAGRVIFNGKNMLELDREELRNTRASLQIIFQDPFSSLDPRMSVGQIIAEPLRNHLKIPKSEIRERVAYLMKRVGLTRSNCAAIPMNFPAASDSGSALPGR